MAQVKISGLPTGTASTAIEIPATDPNDLSTPTGKTFKYTLSDITTVTGAVANGGTGANAVGANGTLAQSDGTKYTFTTATYPGTATNTNHLMRADGTNWVASTNTQLTSNDELSGLTKLDVDNIQINGNVISSTNTNGNIQLIPNGTGQVEINDPGLETGGILVDGAAFETAFRVNDIGGADPAQMILHRHSTTWEPIILSARSNSNTTGHATVTAGMPVLNIYGTGWLNSYYGTVASITFSADTTGTLADGSAPGRLQFNVTPNGALLPVEAMRINNTGVATLAKDAVINGVNIGKGAGSIATNTRVGVNALAANTTGANNSASGNQSLLANTTGSSNTAFGSQALYTNSTGGNNVGVGYQALYLTTASNNTSIGNFALYTNSSGSSNTAVGFAALTNSTTVTGLTAVGESALRLNTTGARNVGLGYQAAYTGTTASDVTALGYQALTLNTAANNTAVGSGAMDACTSGTGVAVGKDALGALTSGTGNTAVGTGALPIVTTGASNTAVGFTAGTSLSASDCCFIGFQSGYNATSGNYNTAIGMGSGRAIRNGDSNTAVGQNALGLLGTSSVAFTTFIGTFSGYYCTGNNNTALGYFSATSGATGAVNLTTGTSNTMLGYRSCPNAADAIGTIGIGADSVAEKATGATSADNGPGIAIGSAAFKVGFRGDGTIYAAAGASAGYWRVKVNGTFYKIQLYADS